MTDQSPYPTTITREALVDKNACREGLECFDEHCPEGILTIENVHAHMALLTGPMAAHEAWAVERGLLSPVRFAGGDYSTLTGGDYSTLTGGYGSTLTGGDGSTLTGGDGSTLTGGGGSTLTGGDYSTLTGGHYSTLTGGYRSTLTGGHDSALTGGHDSALTGGDDSTLTGGHNSTLAGGYGSTLTGGGSSTLTWKWYDGRRYRLTTVYVGEDDILPDTAYICNKGTVILKETK